MPNTGRRPGSDLRHIRVACAIIAHDGRILAAQRNERMSRALKWEFPGGKIGAGETPEECVIREIREELDLTVVPVSVQPPVRHSYGDITIELVPVICRLAGGTLRLQEHKNAAWFKPQELPSLDWSAADQPVLRQYLRAELGY